MRGRRVAISRLIALMPLLFGLSGCVLGPGSLLHSRGNWNRVVQQTSREELLLNLVRMRYNQSVEFMSVPSITGQYTYNAAVGGSGLWRETLPTGLGSSLEQGESVESWRRGKLTRQTLKMASK